MNNEKESLVNNKLKDIKEQTINRPLTGILVGTIVFLQIGSFTILVFALNQYVYSEYKKEKFPNVTDKGINGSACHTDKNSTGYKTDQVLQSDTARWTIYTSLTQGIPAIITAPLISSLSDGYGRKKTLLIPLFGSLVKSGLCLLSIFLELNVNYFILIYLIDGCTGGFSSLISISSSSFADITEPGKQRSMAFAILGLGVGVGFILGTFLSGYLIEAFGFYSPVLASVVLIALATLLTIFLLPEPLKQKNKVESVHPIKLLKKSLDLYIHGNEDSNYGRNWQYLLLLIAFNLLTLANLGRINVEILYQIGPPFCWTPTEVSNFGTIRSLVQEVVGVIVIRLLQNCISDDVIGMIGSVSNTGYYVMEAIATNTFQLYLVPAVGCLGIINITMIRSIMSRMTPPDKQGLVFGGIALFENICNMVGSVAGGTIYSETLSFLPGFVFFVMAGYNVVALLLTIIFYFGSKLNHTGIVYDEIDISSSEAEKE